MSDDLNTSAMSWSEAAAAASSFHKIIRAAAKIEKACEKARDAEDYMKRAHSEKKVLEEKVTNLTSQVTELEDTLNAKKSEVAEKVSEMDEMVRTRQTECDQWVRDAENNARKTIDALDKAKSEAERNLTVEREKMKDAVAAEMQPIRDRHNAAIQELEHRIGTLKSEVSTLNREKDRLNSVLEEARNKFANLGV